MTRWAPPVNTPGSSGVHRVALWFHWNGVIVDDFDRARTAVQMVLRSRGFPEPSLELSSIWLQPPFDDLFNQVGVPPNVRANALRQWNELMTALPAPLQPGIAELFFHLDEEGRQVGALSRASSAVIAADAHRYHLAKALALAYGDVTDVRASLAHQAAGLPPRSVVYIRHTEDDMRAARAAGVLAVGFTRSNGYASRLRSAGADRVVEDLAHILDHYPVTGTRLSFRSFGA